MSCCSSSNSYYLIDEIIDEFKNLNEYEYYKHLLDNLEIIEYDDFSINYCIDDFQFLYYQSNDVIADEITVSSASFKIDGQLVFGFDDVIDQEFFNPNSIFEIRKHFNFECDDDYYFFFNVVHSVVTGVCVGIVDGQVSIITN